MAKKVKIEPTITDVATANSANIEITHDGLPYTPDLFTTDRHYDLISPSISTSQFSIQSPVQEKNWKSRVKPEYFVVNKQRKDKIEKQFGKPLGEISIESIDDSDKLILLAGFKEVALERSYDSCIFEVISDSIEYVTVKCTIKWSSGPTTSALGNAHPRNVEGFMQDFLVAAAENRAFVRCVRNFLQIHVLGKDEISPVDISKGQPNKMSAVNPVAILQNKLEEKGKSFDQFKLWYSSFNPESTKWISYSDIPTGEIHDILFRLKSK